MSLLHKARSLLKTYGGAAKFAAQLVVETVLPGPVGKVIGKVIDCAMDTAKDKLDVKVDEEDQARLEKMFDLLQGDLQGVMVQLVALEKVPDQAQQILDKVLATDAHCQKAALELKNLGAQLGRIETIVVQVQEGVGEIKENVGALREGQEEQLTILHELRILAKRNYVRPGEVSARLVVSINNEREQQQLKRLRDLIRQLPPEKQQADDLMLLADCLAAAGMFPQAREEHAAAAQAAGRAQNRAQEAEAHFKTFRDACEDDQWDNALQALLRAAELDPARFEPFPLHRYQPQRLLGAGGFGAVFLCRDQYSRQKEVAVKTLYTADLARSVDDIFVEAQTLSELQHPALIGVRYWEFADGRARTRPYIVMDYFPGTSLREYLDQHGVLLPADLLAVATQVAAGMYAAHQANVLHRDLKPENILVGKNGDDWEVKIIDFGLAVRQQAVSTSIDKPPARRTVLEQSFAGTFKYAPPEQKGELPKVPVGFYSDVYTFGKTCCEALFQNPDPRREFKGLPPDFQSLADLLESCISWQPKDRPQEFAFVLRKLEEVAQRGQAEDEARRRQQEAERQRQQEELARLQEEGATKLANLMRHIYDRTGGKPTKNDLTPANDLCRQYRLPKDQALSILNQVRDQWKERQRQEEARQAAEEKERHSQRERAKQQQLQPGHIFTNTLGMKFAWIPPGTFMMGSPQTEADRNPDEKDFDAEIQHQVTLTKDFYLGIHTVTVGNFRSFVRATSYKTEAETSGGAYGWTGSDWKLDPKYNWQNPGFQQDDREPVVCVSWNDATAFCRWLTELAAEKSNGRLYRLPTEAEWEYACRGGAAESLPFHFGKSLSSTQANFDGNYPYGGAAKGPYLQKTAPVGSYQSNAWGLYDMHGNVWEWCQDWYGEYPKGPVTDPEGPASGDRRVLRGGSWLYSARFCRAAYRNRLRPGYRNYSLGLRVVCFAPPRTL